MFVAMWQNREWILMQGTMKGQREQRLWTCQAYSYYQYPLSCDIVMTTALSETLKI